MREGQEHLVVCPKHTAGGFPLHNDIGEMACMLGLAEKWDSIDHRQNKLHVAAKRKCGDFAITR